MRYANSNMNLVKRNQKLHNPDSPLLLGDVNDGDVVKDINEPSYYLAQYLPDMIIKACSILSSNITYIYIAQWFFIPLGVILLVYLFKSLVFNDLICAIFSIFIVVLSTLVAVYYKKLRTSKR